MNEPTRNGDYACGRCGAPRQGMRIPESWPESSVKAWKALEPRFLCDACTDLVNGYAESALADLAFAEDAVAIYTQDNGSSAP